jgi:DNA-binding HxlR family transcriptional regulator
MKERNTLKILAQSHAIDILSSLNKEKMRFIDLKAVCLSNRTRSARLKELEEADLIKAVPGMVHKRAYTFYEITPIGKEALKLAEKLITLRQQKKE